MRELWFRVVSEKIEIVKLFFNLLFKSLRFLICDRLIELATTCVLREQRVVYTANYTNCECESANKLFDEGVITCDDVCPDDCVACNSCFELRCDLNTTPPATTNSETTNPETNDRESSGSTENGNESENLDDNSTRVFDLSNCSSYAVPW